MIIQKRFKPINIFFKSIANELDKITMKIKPCEHPSKDLVFIRNIHGDEINQLNARSIWICPKCNKIIYKDQLFDKGKLSDGYHTFNELYHHRAILFAVICNNHKDIAWKSLKHYDSPMYDGMFIVGINTPEGQATYHYDIDDYWFLFDVTELPRAPKWDGHTPDESIKRIQSLIKNSRNKK